MRKIIFLVFLTILTLGWGQTLPIIESESRAKLLHLCDDVTISEKDNAVTVSNLHYYYNTFLDSKFMLGCLSNSTPNTIKYIDLLYSLGEGNGKIHVDLLEANTTQAFYDNSIFLPDSYSDIYDFIIDELSWETKDGERKYFNFKGKNQFKIDSYTIDTLERPSEDYCKEIELGDKQVDISFPLVISYSAYYKFPIPFGKEAESAYLVGCLKNLSEHFFNFRAGISGKYKHENAAGWSRSGTRLRFPLLFSQQTVPFYFESNLKLPIGKFDFIPSQEELLAPVSIVNQVDAQEATSNEDSPLPEQKEFVEQSNTSSDDDLTQMEDIQTDSSEEELQKHFLWVLDRSQRLQVVSSDGEMREEIAPVNIDSSIGGRRIIAISDDGSFAISSSAYDVIDKLARYNIDGTKAWSLSSGRYGAVDITKENYAYVIKNGDNSSSGDKIQKISADTGKVEKEIDLSYNGFDIVVDEDNGNLWVAGQEISLLDLELNEKWTIDPVDWYIISIDYTSDGSLVAGEGKYIRERGKDRLLRINVEGEITDEFSLDSRPLRLTVNRQNDDIWVVGRKLRLFQPKEGSDFWGEPILVKDIAGAYADVVPNNGSVWVSSENKMLNISREGEILNEIPRLGFGMTCFAVFDELPPSNSQAQSTETDSKSVMETPETTELVKRIKQGGKVEIAAGTYILDEPLTLTKSVQLIGAGQDKTFITSSTSGHVVEFKGNGKFVARGISFEHTGNSTANVLVVNSGEINLADCSFKGGVRHNENWDDYWNYTNGGVGLWIGGDVKGYVSNSIIDNNEDGFQIGGNAELILEQNTIKNNSMFGIIYGENSRGTALSNIVEGNGLHGIGISGESQPKLEQNILKGNAEAGIYYNENAKGTAIDNTIEENGLIGIGVSGEAQPRLEQNTLRNTGPGIIYQDNAKGIAVGNIIEESSWDGIRLSGEAQPKIEQNTIRNHSVGISYIENAGGVVVNNTIEENSKNGIHISGDAQPKLETNTLKNNGNGGILYEENASGTAIDNIIEENGLNGIIVLGKAQPRLEQNILSNHTKYGIRYEDNAEGTAIRNIIERDDTGIGVFGNAQPILEQNTLRNNDGTGGILYGGNARGTAMNNIIEENEFAGIYLVAEAQPRLEGNILKNNHLGIYYGGNAGGVAVSNIIEENSHSGIQLGDEAQPRIEQNTFSNNAQFGLSYLANSGGIAIDNVSEGSEIGIHVSFEAEPRLEQNTIRNNTENGIDYSKNTGGTASNNTIEGNGLHGIHIKGEAEPTLENNTILDNEGYGIAIFEEANPTIGENAMEGNKLGNSNQ